MDLQLRGRRAIVTGASRGIGLAIARALTGEGVDVAICARGEAALRRAEQELRRNGTRVFAAVCDVVRVDELEAFLESARSTLGGVDILVNNVSALAQGDTEEAWHANFTVDVMTAVRATHKVVPWMTPAGGTIVHISSTSGLDAGSPPAYAAAKAALISYSKSSAIALAPHGIRVNVIAPGSTEFPGGLWDRLKQTNRPMYDGILGTIPWGRLGTPEEVADVVTFVASPRANWMCGACVNVDGGQHKANL